MEKHDVNPRWFVCGLLPLVILAAGSAADAGRVEYVEEVSRTIQVDPDAFLVLTNTSGDTEVTSWERNEIRIFAHKTVRARSSDEAKEYAEDLEVEVRKEGTDRVIVETRYPEWGGGGFLDVLLSKRPSGSVDYDIKVPAGATVVVQSTSGDVSVEEVTGSVAVAVTSGDVSVAGVRGPTAVTSTSGEIEISEVDSDLEVSATSGDVSMYGVRGSVVAGVTSGDIHCQEVVGLMELGGTSSTVWVVACRGDIRVVSSRGDIEVEEHRGGVKVETSAGYVDLEIESLEGGECDVTTSSGDVEIGLGEDGSYEFIIETVSGEIDVEMPEEMDVQATANSLRAKYRGGKQRVRISTISGDILIEGL